MDDRWVMMLECFLSIFFKRKVYVIVTMLPYVQADRSVFIEKKIDKNGLEFHSKENLPCIFRCE